MSITTTVEIGFTSSGSAEPYSVVWTDVTAWVELNPGITIRRGRQDEFSDVQPSQLTLVLTNADDRFTPGNPGSPYYPNVTVGKYIRVTVTTDIARRRFTGHITGWSLNWAQGHADKTVTVTAADRLRRFANADVFRSVIEETILTPGSATPVAYYPLGEPQGSTTGLDASGRDETPLAVRNGGGSITFGAGTGPGTDGLSAPMFTQLDPMWGSSHLVATLKTPSSYDETTGAGIALSLWFNCTSVNSFFPASLIELRRDDRTKITIGLRETFFGSGVVELFGELNIAQTTTDLPTPISLNQTHHVILICAPGQTMRMFLNATPVFGFTCDLDTAQFSELVVGKYFTGTIAHTAVHSGIELPTATDISRQYQAGIGGFIADESGERISRYLDWLAVYARVIATGRSRLQFVDSTGKNPLQLLRQATAAENGTLFVDDDGFVTFQARDQRWNQPAALTLDADTDIAGGLTYRIDDQHLTNDITVKRPGGISARIIDTTSMQNFGLAKQSQEHPFYTDAEVVDRAHYIAANQTQPHTRIAELPIDLAGRSQGFANSVLALTISDTIAITGLSAQAPAITTFIVEGSVDTITTAGMRVTVNTSPAIPAASQYWELDNATFSVLGTTTRLAF